MDTCATRWYRVVLFHRLGDLHLGNLVGDKMTFEEDFPSLKGQTAELVLTEDHDGVKKTDYLSVGVFFGSLYGEGPLVHTLDVEVNCLDKQRVRDVVERWVGDDQVVYEIKKELGL